MSTWGKWWDAARRYSTTSKSGKSAARKSPKFDRTYCGLDWGWYPDPNHFGEMAYSSPSGRCTSSAEHRATREKDEDLARVLEPWKGKEIIADSAGNKSIATLRDLGYRGLRGCTNTVPTAVPA